MRKRFLCVKTIPVRGGDVGVLAQRSAKIAHPNSVNC